MKHYFIVPLLTAILCVGVSNCSKKNPTQFPVVPGDGNNAPYRPAMPHPSDDAAGQDTAVTVTWICTDPDSADTLTYDVYADTIAQLTLPRGVNQAATWLDLHNLLINRTYYWKVTAKDNHGIQTAGPVWRFRTFTGFPAWTSKASMPLPRQALAVAAGSGLIYAIAGAGSSFIPWYNTQVYNPNNNIWSAAAALPKPLMGVVGVSYNDSVYVLGGNNEVSPNYYSTVYKYRPSTDSWTQCAPMTEPRVYAAAAAVQGKIYAIGGINGSGYLSSVEAYDPSSDTWSTKAPMSKQRCGLATAVVNGRIYAIGGWNPTDGDLSLVEEYDPTANTWVTRNSMPTPRSYLCAAVTGSILYAIGGRNQSASSLNDNDAYDCLANTWRSRSPMPSSRAFCGAAVINSKIYVVGGYDGFNPLTTVEEYNPASEP